MLKKPCYYFSKVCQLNATSTSSVLEAITSFYSRGKYYWGTSIRFILFCALINYEKLMFNGNRKTKKIKVINSALLLINILPIPKMFYIFLRGSVEYNEENLAEAEKCQRRMSADMGGTEIYRALKQIYSRPPFEGFDRQVCLVQLAPKMNYACELASSQ